MNETALFGVFDEVEDVFDLVGLGQFALNRGDGLGQREPSLEDDTIGFVNRVDDLAFKAATAQANDVQTAIRGRFTCTDGVGHDALWGACATTNHRVASDAAELVYEHASRKDGMVVNGDFSGKLRTVAYDDIIANNIVVGDVAAFHQEIARADNGLSFGCGAAVDGDVLADLVVVANDGQRVLATELQVLGNGTDDGSWKENIARSDAGAIKDGDAVH